MAEIGTEPWSWPEERWRSAVEQVRAGRALKPKKWKGGARCAVALSFDCDFETRALDADSSDIIGLGNGQYGARAGLPRILRLLKRHNVSATFFMPAVTAMLHGAEVKGIVAQGHEIGLSSWIGEARQGLTAEAERDLLLGARTALESTASMKPVGFRGGRGGFSAHTLKIIQEMGLAYDSSLSGDDEPYDLTQAGQSTGIVEMPIGLNDADFFEGAGSTSPEEVFDIFRRELETAYEEGGLTVLALHPEIIGRRSRIWIIEEFLKVARTLPGVWISTLADIATFAKGKA